MATLKVELKDYKELDLLPISKYEAVKCLVDGTVSEVGTYTATFLAKIDPYTESGLYCIARSISNPDGTVVSTNYASVPGDVTSMTFSKVWADRYTYPYIPFTTNRSKLMDLTFSIDQTQAIACTILAAPVVTGSVISVGDVLTMLTTLDDGLKIGTWTVNDEVSVATSNTKLVTAIIPSSMNPISALNI